MTHTTTTAQDVHEARHLMDTLYAQFAHRPSALHWKQLEAAMIAYQQAVHLASVW